MRRNWFYTGLFIFCVVFFIAGTLLIKWPDFQNKVRLHSILNSPSALDVSLTMSYDKPPIYKEQYTMRNRNGVSTAQYAVQGYNGKLVTITMPPAQTHEVTFFFEETVQDGIWKLMNKSPAGDTSVHYRLYIHQLVNGAQGSRTITFTDPRYWALEAGRQYQIHMNGATAAPSPGYVTLGGTTAADPRYLKIVDDFRNFGPPSFRQKVAQAQRLVRSSK